MMMGTILSELHLSHEFLLALSIPKLIVLYQEAMRQRTNKAFMLMELLGLHRLEDKSDRKNLIDGYTKLTKPFVVKQETRAIDVTTGWATLRGKARR